MAVDPGIPSGERTPLGDEPAFVAGLIEVAEGTYAWLQPNGGLGESNAGLIVVKLLSSPPSQFVPKSKETPRPIP